MGYTLNGKFRICRIPYTGVIAELGHIQGPVNKCKLTTRQIKLLISNGKPVYELDPKDLKNEVKLTLTNCETSPFETNEKTEVPKQPVKEVIKPAETKPDVEKVDEEKSTESQAQASGEKNNNYKHQNDYKNKNKHNNQKNNTESVDSVDIQ